MDFRFITSFTGEPVDQEKTKSFGIAENRFLHSYNLKIIILQTKATELEFVLYLAPGTETNELDLVALAPKRPDWDLKRAIEPRLDRLKKKTERSIAELIRERLRATNDLAAQVAAAGPDEFYD